MNAKIENRWLPGVLLTFTTLFWSFNFIFGRTIARDIPPVTLSFFRWLVALAILRVVVRKDLAQWKGKVLPHWKVLAALGSTGIMSFSILVYLSLHYTQAINATLLNSLNPAIVALLAFFLLKEDLRRAQWLGIIISMLGGILIIFRGNPGDILTLNLNRGDAFMFLAVFLWGIYNILMRRHGKILPMPVLFFGTAAAAVTLMAPLMVIELAVGGLAWTGSLTMTHGLALLYTSIFPSILSFWFFNRAVLMIGPSRSAIYMNLVIVFTAIQGMLFLKESLYWFHLAGALLIVLGIRLTTAPPGKQDVKVEGTTESILN